MHFQLFICIFNMNVKGFVQEKKICFAMEVLKSFT